MLTRMQVFPKGMHHYWKSEFLPGLPGAMLDACRQQAAAITTNWHRAAQATFRVGKARVVRPSS
jgi:hypothetical protein